MVGTILLRELHDHLLSVRFAIALALTVGLFAANGLFFAGGEYAEQAKDYRQSLQDADDWREQHAAALSQTGIRGPGHLAKKPSPLVFCASGRDEFLPRWINARTSSSHRNGSWGLTLYMPWHLQYDALVSPPESGVVSDFVEIDWVFIVGFALSLMALLLTYDGICGERVDGTLKLVLSGSVSRFSVLAGKFAAAWLVLLAALLLGAVVNLLIVAAQDAVALDGDFLFKIAAMLLASALYLAFFVALGLLVSTRVERPGSSLVSLLLIWTALLVLLPNTTAGVVGYFGYEAPDWREREDARQALWDEHQLGRQQNPNPEGRMPREFVKVFADFVAARIAFDDRWQRDALRAQLAPILLGRNLNRLSPYGVYQYAMESLSDTGLARHLRFIEAARRYAPVFRNFIEERDAADPDSYHLFGIEQGMSAEPVPPEAIPRFKEDLSAGATLEGTTTDLLLLLLFAVIALMAANLAFLRGDVV